MNIGRWALAESPGTVEYSLGVLEQIRALAEDGLHRLSRGGVDVSLSAERRDGQT